MPSTRSSAEAAEAAGVRAYITDLLAGEEASAVIVAGDLNDEPQAATTQILHGPPGSEVGTAGFDRPDAGDPQRLWNTAAFLDDSERWSPLYRGRRELIEYVLCSAQLIKAVVSATTGGMPIASIADDPGERRNEPGSDHRSVM